MNTHPPTTRKPRWTRWAIYIGVAIMVLGVAWLRDSNAQDRVNWRTDYTAAVQEARETDRPLLMNFGAEWCPPCNMMKSLTFSDKAVATAIETRFVPVYIDADKHPEARELQHRFQIEAYPTLVIVDGERELSRAHYLPKSDLMSWLDTGDTQLAAR